MTISIQEVRAEIRRVLLWMRRFADALPVTTLAKMVSAGLDAIEQAPPPEPAAVCPACYFDERKTQPMCGRHDGEGDLRLIRWLPPKERPPFTFDDGENEPAPVAPVVFPYKGDPRLDLMGPTTYAANAKAPAAPRPPSGDLSELREALADFDAHSKESCDGTRIAMAVRRHIAAAQAEQGEM